MAAHTEGPWKWQKVSPVGGDTDLFFIGRGTMNKTAGHELVAEVLSEEPWGDAQLIAAAPDLLAACKMMASPGCSGCRGRVPWVHNAALTSDIEPLRKICLAFANVWNNYMWPAIAKAEGQAENAP